MKKWITILLGCCIFCGHVHQRVEKIYTDDGTELFISSKNTDVVNIVIEENTIQIRNRPNDVEIPYIIVSKEEKIEILDKYDFIKTP